MVFEYEIGEQVYRVVMKRNVVTNRACFGILPTVVDKITITRAGICYHTTEGGDNIKYDNILYKSAFKAQQAAEYANSHIEQWLKKHKGYAYFFEVEWM